MTPYEYLRGMVEPTPKWLLQFNEDNLFDRKSFFSSRIVYYPGSGTDGQPIKLFASTHSAHCLIYSDYGLAQGVLDFELYESHPFLGYHSLGRIQLSEEDISPKGWTPQLFTKLRNKGPRDILPYAFLEVFERDSRLDDSHGAIRFAVLFLCADGIAAYDAIFCQYNGVSTPFATVLQDHGFGGNYDKFGGGGLLEKIAYISNCYSKFQLVAENTDPWSNYKRIDYLDGDVGGMHNTFRYLHKQVM